MSWIDWIIIVVPLASIFWLAFYTRKYGHSVVNFLASGRVAGRYVMTVSVVTSALSVQSIIGNVEQHYKTGYAISFWNNISVPLGIILTLTGYCIYRFRASKALSIGQFLEVRYSRSFRVVAATIRTIAEAITNALSPAIAANFFIYFLGLPHRVHILGLNLPCFGIVLAVCLTMSLILIWPAGRVTLLVTDTLQSLLSYPIFVIIVGYLIYHFSWGTDIAPVMFDRVEGESFFNPYDIEKLRDFNLFALVVSLFSTVLNRSSWAGNDTNTSGKTAHEQKMANLLGNWRSGLSGLMTLLIVLIIITAMNADRLVESEKFSSHKVRQELIVRVADQILVDKVPNDKAVLAQIKETVAALPPHHHVIGVDAPMSQNENLDTPYIDAVRDVINGNIPPELAEEAAAAKADREAGRKPSLSPELAAVQGANAKKAQEFRTVYGQMMLPMAIRRLFPTGMLGVFCLLMVMLFVTTDDSRISNSSFTIVQDMILPFYKKPPTPEKHIRLLRVASFWTTVFFFCSALFFKQIDYINMFCTIMCAIWLGGAGPIMVFGLYSRFGNTAGAWCSLIFGSGTALAGMLCQRLWASTIYPFLSLHNWQEGVRQFLIRASSPFVPYVDWNVSPESFAEKFPINSTEISFLAMVSGLVAYLIGSYVAMKLGLFKPFNLDRMLHRGEYMSEEERERHAREALRKKPSLISRLVGINSEYSRGDRILAWSVFIYVIVYRFGLTFVGVILWNIVAPWPREWWGHYFWFTNIFMGLAVGTVTTVWFLIGGTRGILQLFRDLDAALDKNDALDNGMVLGDVPASNPPKTKN